ncbi:phage tail terminator protein [Crenobacter caeni]|uniref:Uncharacterized protein n=1 Tax=Crenobacter caeni TaxID=2705474 RepID=A0A6B2KN64_9NEIS|nr:hypothetical protein [Crenobacter caeni]NDV11672.1 hypothetical protein [Crenobacter caeni]
MKITPIITHLRARCPSFSGRVAGALELSALLEENAPLMALPAAYVVPTRDDPESVTTNTPYQQPLLEQFDVVLALSTSDERGQAVADRLHDLRSELWRALLGWRPSDLYEPIEYDGGDMLLLNRARVLYRYAFRLESQIGGVRSAGAPPETWHDVAQDGLPGLSGMRAGVDYAVPDGRIEHQLDVKFTTNP